MRYVSSKSISLGALALVFLGLASACSPLVVGLKKLPVNGDSATIVREWQHALRAQNIGNTFQAVLVPQVALNANGEALAIWRQSDGVNDQVYQAFRNAAGQWTLPQGVNDSLSFNVRAQGVVEDAPLAFAFNLHGQAIVVWGAKDGKKYFKAERAANGTWSVPADASDTFNFTFNFNVPISELQLALGDSGQAILAWLQTDGSFLSTLFKAERATNGTWTFPTSDANRLSVATYPVEIEGDGSGSYRLAMNGSDQAILVWMAILGGATRVYKAERAANGTWTLPAGANDDVRGTGVPPLAWGTPGVALNDAGQAIILWSLVSGEMYKAERAANGVWTFPTSNADKFFPAGLANRAPRVAMNAAGEALATWQGVDINGVDPDQIYKAERAANGTWTMPGSLMDFISFAGTNNSGPRVAFNATGVGLITWMNSDLVGQPLGFKAERAANGTWTLPSGPMDAYGIYHAPWIDPLLNDAGQAILVWERGDPNLGATHASLVVTTRAANGTWTIPTFPQDEIFAPGHLISESESAINARGEAIVLWSQMDSSDVKRVYKAERSAAGAWTVPANEADYFFTAPAGTHYYRVKMNDVGQAVVAWTSDETGFFQVYQASRTAAGAWTLPAGQNDHLSIAGRNCSFPDLALNNRGETVIVWRSYNAGGGQIYKAERSAAGAWTIPATIDDRISGATHNGANSAVVALNDAGQAVVAMNITNTAASQRLVKAERSALGVWTTPTDSTAEAISPSAYSSGTLRINAAGEVMIGWLSGRVYRAERTANGVWTIPSGVADSVSFGASVSSLGDVRLNDAGQALLTWIQSNGTHSMVYKAERDAVGTWIKPTALTESLSVVGQSASALVSTMNASGQVLISWLQSNGTRLQAYVAERTGAGVWSAPATLADSFSDQTQVVSSSLIALSDAGEATLIYRNAYDFYLAQKPKGGTWAKWVDGALFADLAAAQRPAAFSGQPRLFENGKLMLFTYPTSNLGMMFSEYAPR